MDDRLYQELTLKLSREQSQLDRACRERRAAIESARLAKLRDLPGAKRAMEKHDQELAAAGAKRDKAVVEAKRQAGIRERELELSRREALDEIERDRKAADQKALAAVTEARRRARANYDAALEAASQRPLGAQAALRREAQRVFEREIGEAEAAHRRALQAGQDARTAAHQRAAEADTAGRRRAREQLNWVIEAAEQTYAAEAAAIRERFLAASTALPEGLAIAADADARANDLRDWCAQQHELLRAEFSKARAELGVDLPVRLKADTPARPHSPQRRAH